MIGWDQIRGKKETRELQSNLPSAENARRRERDGWSLAGQSLSSSSAGIEFAACFARRLNHFTARKKGRRL
ncbi:hypothetical protein RISK_003819 [Rhodopirellula islandica]|uniref:Uncharacterized protein n=1 Tax=Rhodopirellula islandica TaxID=595434 RepID=A0A0J1BCF0_RHOIS|nr:hypothetical protein RISK_003819 [Rhodopirellula islandica]